MSEAVQVIPLPIETAVRFLPFTEQYGAAEWEVCVQWTRRRYDGHSRHCVSRLFVFPRQQPDKHGICYEVEIPSGGIDFEIASWMHLGISAPHIWRTLWCDEHRCMSMGVYSPPQADSFYVSGGSGVCLRFEGEHKTHQRWLRGEPS